MRKLLGAGLAMAVVSLGALQGCAATVENSGQRAERDEGTIITGSRIPRRDKGGPSSAVTIIEGGNMDSGLRAAGASGSFKSSPAGK